MTQPLAGAHQHWEKLLALLDKDVRNDPRERFSDNRHLSGDGGEGSGATDCTDANKGRHPTDNSHQQGASSGAASTLAESSSESFRKGIGSEGSWKRVL